MRQAGGGTGQPAASIPTNKKYTLDDSQVVKLQNELSRQQERRNKLADASDDSKRELQDAQRSFDAAESRTLAGRADARSLELARKALDDARVRHAKLSLDYEEADRLATEILPAAIQEAKNTALAQLRDTLRAETQAKAKQLAAVLAQAKGLSDDLRLLSDTAQRHFTVFDMIRLKVTLMGRLDLGEFGWVAPNAGIPNLACPWLTGRTLEQPTMHSVWLRELEAYLAKTPAEMAQEDVVCRETMLARDERDYKAALAQEAAQKKLEQLIEARAGGRMPKGTKLLD